MHMPWQHLKHEVEAIGKRTRYKQVAKVRSLLCETTGEVDDQVLQRALTKQEPEDRHWLLNILTLGRWSPFKLAFFMDEQDGTCPHCGHADADLIHMLWKSPCLAQARTEGDADMGTLQPECLPQALRVGIPEAIHASDDDYLWDTNSDDQRAGIPEIAMMPKGKFGRKGLHARGRDVLDNRNEQEHAHNARQLIAHKKVSPLVRDMPVTEACTLSKHLSCPTCSPMAHSSLPHANGGP
jgi:hypothetical protein